MRHHRLFGSIITVILTAALLSGCGESFPVLTQEEYNLIVDYSAGVLSKYSKGNGDKLTRVMPEVPEEEGAENEPPAVPVQTPKKDAPAEKPAPAAEPAEDQTDTGTADTEEAPIIVNTPGGDIADEGEPDEGNTGNDTDTGEEPAEENLPEASDGTETAQQVAIGNGDLLQKMQEGIEITFNGYYVLNSYPDSSSAEYASLKAEPGNKLLILSFTMTNRSGTDTGVDFLNANPTFTLYINGQPVSRQMVTVLDNDMGTYMGQIPGGGSAGAVLCFNVKEAQARSINTMSLKLNLRGEEQMLGIE